MDWIVLCAIVYAQSKLLKYTSKIVHTTYPRDIFNRIWLSKAESEWLESGFNYSNRIIIHCGDTEYAILRVKIASSMRIFANKKIHTR